LKNKIIFSFLLVSFSGLLIPPGPAFAESPIPDSEPQCLPYYPISGINYELEFEEFIKNWNDGGEWKRIRCSYEAPDDAVLPAGTPFSAVYVADYTDNSMKNPVYLCDRSEIASESVALTFFYDDLSAHVWSTDHVAYWKVSRADIEAQAYNQLDVIANFATTCYEEIEKAVEELNVQPTFEILDPIYWCEDRKSDPTKKILPGKILLISGEVFVKQVGSPQWTLAYEGMPLKTGDLVKTGPGALARIELVDETGKIHIDISPDSEFCMREEADEKQEYVIINLFKGFFNAVTLGWSNGSIFSAKAGTTIVGIRGTDFVISYDPDLNKVNYYLKDGIIEITETTTGETKTLTAGQTLEISNGQMQPVSALTSDVWDSLVQQTGGVITVIPDWVKNNAGWWADDMIEDSDFAQGIAYLISEGIMTIPETAQAETKGDTQGIPSWVKNNAGWWADGQITDDDFVKGIQYLVGLGIIRV